MNTHALVLLALACPLVVGCRRAEEDKTPLAPPAKHLAASKPGPEAMTTRYAIAPDGTTSIEMPAPKEHIKARTTSSAGALDVDLPDLSRTLVARYFHPAGAPPRSAPDRIAIATARPMQVVLAEHDVKPRDPFGKIAQGSFHLLGTKVAGTASVTLDLGAERQP
jgi:hypothetical protein